MKSQYFRFAVLLVSALTLAGCSTFTNPGAPEQSFNIDQDIQDLEEAFKEKGVTIISFYSIEAEETTEKEAAEATAKLNKKKKESRNQFISQRLTLINIQYIKFIRQFALDKAQLDSAIDITTIGVGLAVTLVGGESVKAILGAVSTGLTGTKVTIDKNFFQEETVPVLITAMNAERKKALVPILRGRGQTLDVYSFEQALSDLHIYYQAGTFLGALQSIQKDSGVKENKADNKIFEIKREAAIASEGARNRVDALLDKIDALSDDDAKALAAYPPVQDDQVDELLAARDSEGEKLWLTVGPVARQALRMRVSFASVDDLTRWEGALQ